MTFFNRVLHYFFMKKETTKILIFLDWDLEIYQLTNHKMDNESKQLVYSLKRENLKVLDLSQKFEEIWTWLETQYLMSEIYYLINDKASFSDSRVIYIWLKTWQMFDHQNKFLMSHNNSFEWVLNPVQLTYLHDVKIGKPKIKLVKS